MGSGLAGRACLSRPAADPHEKTTMQDDQELLRFEQRDAVGLIRLARPAKRNAISDPLIARLRRCFAELPESVRAVVIAGDGDHFCAGLDLSSLRERTPTEGMLHSMGWHDAFNAIQFGRVPVVAALHGAVIGGGLELACAAHIRVAEPSAFYALPEGQHGLFVGGGGSVRIPRLIGVARMTDMMLAGRVYGAEEGHQIGLSQYLVGPDEALPKALELAARAARNAAMTNFAVMHALPRIASQPIAEGLMMESMVAAIASSSSEAQERMQAFLDKRAGKVDRPA